VESRTPVVIDADRDSDACRNLFVAVLGQALHDWARWSLKLDRGGLVNGNRRELRQNLFEVESWLRGCRCTYPIWLARDLDPTALFEALRQHRRERAAGRGRLELPQVSPQRDQASPSEGVGPRSHKRKAVSPSSGYGASVR
jgi:hypothetical protein